MAEDIGLLRLQLQAFLQAAAQRAGRIVILLDAVNQLPSTDGAHSLAWLPVDLPPNVRLIVSTLPHACLDNLRRLRLPELPVLPLDDASCRLLVRAVLARHGKELSESAGAALGDQLGILLGKPHGRSPLYLLAACDRLVNSGAGYDQARSF